MLGETLILELTSGLAEILGEWLNEIDGLTEMEALRLAEILGL